MVIADLVVIGVIVLAALVAFSLGVVRVVLSLAGWAGAGLATLYGFSYVRPYARDYIDSALLADGAAAAGLFVASLIVLTVISHVLARRVKGTAFGAVDRSLGLLAGLALGIVVVCGAFIVMSRVMELPSDPDQRPQWIREARTAPLVERGARYLLSLMPEEWHGEGGAGARLADPLRTVPGDLEKLLSPQTKAAAPRRKSGYNTRERREMDRLLQSRQ